jgi:hypothetical protein
VAANPLEKSELLSGALDRTECWNALLVPVVLPSLRNNPAALTVTNI